MDDPGEVGHAALERPCHVRPGAMGLQAEFDPVLGFERLEDRVFPDGFVLLTYRRPIGPPID